MRNRNRVNGICVKFIQSVITGGTFCTGVYDVVVGITTPSGGTQAELIALGATLLVVSVMSACVWLKKDEPVILQAAQLGLMREIASAEYADYVEAVVINNDFEMPEDNAKDERSDGSCEDIDDIEMASLKV